MPSKNDSDQERRTDSWLFRLANKRDSNARVFCYIWYVAATVAMLWPKVSFAWPARGAPD